MIAAQHGAPGSEPTAMDQFRFDIPTADAGTRPFWDGVAEGRLLIKRCRDCSRAHFYPRAFCPHCWSQAVEWEQAAGLGTLYTWSVVHVNDLPPFDRRVPYIAALAELAEGPRMMTNIIDCSVPDLRAGMELELACRAVNGAPPLPFFRPRGLPPA
jgi:hypothetical protein